MSTPAKVAGPSARPAARAASASPILQRKCACGSGAGVSGECDECQGKRLQRRATDGESLNEIPPSVGEVLRGPGSPLDPALRSYFEPRFKHDFSAVRVHTDGAAARSAAQVNALAYTVGSHVVFGKGQYAPESAAGQRLLAHELTHVAQQGAGLQPAGAGAPDSPQEREAEAAERAIANDQSVQVRGGGPTVLRRAPAPGTSSLATSDCRPDQTKTIDEAIGLANTWVTRAIDALQVLSPTADIRDPSFPAREWVVKDSMQRHFRGIAHVDAIRSNFQKIAQPLREMAGTAAPKAPRPPPVQLPDGSEALEDIAEDPKTAPSLICADDCGGPNAKWNSRQITFCRPFFNEPSTAGRAVSVIHELAHGFAARLGNPPPKDNDQGRARDLAAAGERSYPYLTAQEAVDNADSYAQFAREVAGAGGANLAPPQDTLVQCASPPFPRNVVEITRRALALAQRWNSAALQAMADSSPAGNTMFDRVHKRYFSGPEPSRKWMTDVFTTVNLAGFNVGQRFECATDCDSGVGAYYSKTLFVFVSSTLKLCPAWFNQWDEKRRADSVYQHLLRHTEVVGAQGRITVGKDAAQLFAAFARDIAAERFKAGV